jgi:hypothetical protein
MYNIARYHLQTTCWKDTLLLDFLHYILRPESLLTEAEQQLVKHRCQIENEQLLSKNACDKVMKELKAWWPDAPTSLTEELIAWCKGWHTEYQAQLNRAQCSTLAFSEFSKYAQSSTENGKPKKLELYVKKYTFDDLFAASASMHQKGEVLSYGELSTSMTDPNQTQTFQALLESGVSADMSIPQDAVDAMDAAFITFMVRHRDIFCLLVLS